MAKNQYIYLLFDIDCPNRFYSNELKIIGKKIGSTCNMKMRMRQYKTSHPDKVPLECYYKILNDRFTCYQIDNMIKKDLNKYRLKGGGGIEFYDANYITHDLIENYFTTNSIIFEKLNEVIYDIITNDDIEDLIYDIQQQQQQQQQSTTNTYLLLDKYIKMIKNEYIVIDIDIVDLLSKKIDDKLIRFLQTKLIDDQIVILLYSIIYFELNDRGIWNLFCRYGKTRLSCLFSLCNNYKRILILVPSIYLIEQTFNTWKEFFAESSIKKVSSQELNTNIIDIENFYVQNEICIFITTYHSSDKFEYLDFDICIYDEAHRTAGIKQKEDTDISFYKKQLLNDRFSKKLFLTATIKEYTGITDDYYTMDDVSIYGQIIATVSALKAKELGRICNYKIITIELKPSIIDINLDSFFVQNNIRNKQDKNNLLKIKDKYVMCAIGLIETMLKYKILHVITFHELIINCKFFKAILNEITKHNSIKYLIETIDGTTPYREQLIKDFEHTSHSILCSAKVLQEGVDIPRCDGIIFIDRKTSIIDTVQSLSRCLTVCNDIPTKEGHIMIPFENTTTILNDTYTNDLRLILRNIAEIDSNIKGFFDQINLMQINDTDLHQIQILNDLKLKYNIDIDSKIISELKEISYEPYTNAKKLIMNRYTHEDDYKLNIKIDLDLQIYNLPLDPDIIYKRFGWKNWNDYLGVDSEMSVRRIRSIIWKENSNRKKQSIELIDTKEAYIKFAIDNQRLELPLMIDIPNGNWIKFCLINYDDLVADHYTIEELKEIFARYKISSRDKYIELSQVDDRLIKYEYISNGFYYESKNGFNINDLYHIEKHKVRRN